MLSLQPGLRVPALAALAQRAGVTFIDAPDGDPARVRAWLEPVRPGAALSPRPDLDRHAGAAAACLDLCRDSHPGATVNVF